MEQDQHKLLGKPKQALLGQLCLSLVKTDKLYLRAMLFFLYDIVIVATFKMKRLEVFRECVTLLLFPKN